MADLETAYENATSAIDTAVTTQLFSSLSWANVPGSLVKADASTAGFVWGFNSNNNVFVCAAPCNGNWTQVDVSKYSVSTIQDIVTDETNVYILMTSLSGKSNLLMGPVTNTGSWNVVLIPFLPTNIFSTKTYIWAQDPNNVKQKCAKPCMMSNWITVPEDKITITSASPTTLYGRDNTGNAMKTDELMQSPWSSVNGFSALKMKSVLGQNDKVGLYGIDTSSNIVRCEGECLLPEEVHPVDSGGYMPLQLTTDSSNLWMTTTTSGPVGNIFTRVEKPDYSTIMNNVNPIEQQRDKIVSNIGEEYNKQTGIMTVNKQLEDIVAFFKKLFPPEKKPLLKDVSNIQDNIRDIESKLSQINLTQPIIQKLLILLSAVAGLYIFGWFFGWIIHLIAIATLAIGLWYIISTSKQ
jgi:hypothetical protein